MKNIHNLVDISTLNPKIVIDIKYATDDNFVGRKLYSQPKAFLRAEVAAQLDKIQKILELEGLGLKIWDAYRPHGVQRILWSMVPDERYVADPKKGSSHNRGAAVDLTLVDAAGNELEMPTKFDDFTHKAHRNYADLSPEVLKNRERLASVMIAHGFTPLETEWWHFNYTSSIDCGILDVSFEELSL